MSAQYSRTALVGTEERTLFCPTLGRAYHLSVALPESYRTSTQAYPVIYVLLTVDKRMSHGRKWAACELWAAIDKSTNGASVGWHFCATG